MYVVIAATTVMLTSVTTASSTYLSDASVKLDTSEVTSYTHEQTMKSTKPQS